MELKNRSCQYGKYWLAYLLHEVSLSNRTMLQLTELATPWSFCARNTPDFISPLPWPPNSPHLNPVDYEVWGVLQQRVYRSRIRDVDHLKQRLIEEWSCFDQNIIDRAVWQWRVRLRYGNLFLYQNKHEFRNKLNWIIKIWGVLLVKMIQYVYKYSNKLTKLGAKVGLCLGKKIFSYTVLPKVKKIAKSLKDSYCILSIHALKNCHRHYFLYFSQKFACCFIVPRNLANINEPACRYTHFSQNCIVYFEYLITNVGLHFVSRHHDQIWNITYSGIK